MIVPSRDVPDYLSRLRYSQILADRIKRYWWERGHVWVRVWVEKDTTSFKKPLYVVRSNIAFEF